MTQIRALIFIIAIISFYLFVPARLAYAQESEIVTQVSLLEPAKFTSQNLATVSARITLQNNSNTAMYEVQVINDIYSYLSHNAFTIEKLSSDMFNVNPAFNGRSVVHMLMQKQQLLPGEQGFIDITFNIENVVSSIETVVSVQTYAAAVPFSESGEDRIGIGDTVEDTTDNENGLQIDNGGDIISKSTYEKNKSVFDVSTESKQQILSAYSLSNTDVFNSESNIPLLINVASVLGASTQSSQVLATTGTGLPMPPTNIGLLICMVSASLILVRNHTKHGFSTRKS